MERQAAQDTYASVNDTRLYYELAGDGPPVVFIHGFGLDTRMWDDQVDHFAQRYRVLRYDLRGFGRSAIPAGERYVHADDLKALLDALAIPRATVVGLSLGGGVAVDFALSYPATTHALVLVDAVLPGFGLSDETGASLAHIWSTGRRQGSAAARAAWLEQPLFAAARAHPTVWPRVVAMAQDYSGWALERDDPGRWVEPPAASRLEQVQAPTLALVGETDLDDFRRIAAACRERIPGARAVTLPGVGHLPNMEDPAAFNAALGAFLDEQHAG